MGDTIIAGCGMEIRKDEGWICPYYSRPEEWQKEHAGYGPCGVDLSPIDHFCCYGQREEQNE